MVTVVKRVQILVQRVHLVQVHAPVVATLATGDVTLIVTADVKDVILSVLQLALDVAQNVIETVIIHVRQTAIIDVEKSVPLTA